MIEIKIHYCLIQSDNIQTVTMQPKDFFYALEKGESYEKDGYPKLNDACQYLKIPVYQLKWTILIVRGTERDFSVRTQFMQEGKGSFTHLKKADGYEEMIHKISMEDGSEHIVKSDKPINGHFMVTANFRIDTNENINSCDKLDYYYRHPDKVTPTNTKGSFAFVEPPEDISE